MKVYELLKKIRPDNRREIAAVLVKLGEVYLLQKDFKMALQYYEEALKIITDVPDAEEADQPEVLIYIGHVYFEEGNTVMAKKYYERAYSIAERFLGERHPFLADILNGDILSNIGLIQNKKGDKKKALQTLREALQIYRDYGLSDDHAAVERTLNNISVVKYGERSSMPTLERSARKMAQNNKAGNLEPLLRSVAAVEEQTLAFADAILETSSKIVGTFKTSVIDFKLEDYVNRIQEVKFQLEGGGTIDFFLDNSTAFDTSNVSNTLSLMSSDYMYEGVESYDDSLLSSDFVESKRR